MTPRVAASLGGAAAVLLVASSAHAQLSSTTPLPGDTAIAPMFGSQFEIAVGAGDGEYMAVWADERTALETTVELDPWEVVQADVFALRLGPDGTPIDSLPIRVDAGAYSQVSPVAASNGTDWLVVYESRSVAQDLGTYTTQDIRAARVSGSGVVLDTTPLDIDTSSEEAYVPDVASDGTDWAAFWVDYGRVLARKVEADGTLGATQVVANPGTWLFDPAAAFAQDRYLVVWEGNGIVGRLLDTGLQPLGPVFQISNVGTDPRIATDGTDFFVTISVGGSWPEVRGTLVRGDGTVVDPNGIVLDGQSYLSLGFPAATWDGSGYVVSWLEWRYQFPTGPENALKFNRIDADGAPVYSAPKTAVLSSDFSVREPVAASLGSGAFLGWLDTRNGTRGHFDGYGTVVAPDGTFPPEQSFLDSPPAQLMPDLASGPVGPTLADDVNLAVFLSADSSETRVVFQRVDGNGVALDPEPVVVAGGADTYVDPVAVWNGELWLVAWEDITGGTGNGGVLAARVLPDGTVLDTTPIQVLDGNEPDVAALDVVGGDFLLAASKLTSGDIRTLYGRRVGSDGTLLDGSPFFLGVNFARSPTIGGFDDRWLVLWYRRPTHDTPSSTLQARFVQADGTVLPLVDPSNSTADELAPDVAVQGGLATFAWSDGTDIRVREVTKSGTFLGSPAGVVVSSAPNEQTAPTLTADGAKRVVTWVDDRIHDIFEPGIGDLFGTRLDASLTPLEPDGVPIAADPKAPEGEAALRGRLGVTTSVHPAMLPAFGTWRVSTGTWRDWSDMGEGGVPGTAGQPRLWMSGLLTAGSQLRFELEGAPPLALGFHVIGFSEAGVGFQGGVLVPAPDVVMPFFTNALGAKTRIGTLNDALPPGTNLWVQTWLVDDGAVLGSAASDASVSDAAP